MRVLVVRVRSFVCSCVHVRSLDSFDGVDGFGLFGAFVRKFVRDRSWCRVVFRVNTR